MRFHVIKIGDTGWCYSWHLEGSPPEFPLLAMGPTRFTTEAECRSSIAAARKAMQGYKFAKVVVDDGA